MDVLVGLDASLASTQICVLDEKGNVMTETQVASEPEVLGKRYADPIPESGLTMTGTF